jgi:tripartite-type tricarboxylate transporter receptor subunit TctC
MRKVFNIGIVVLVILLGVGISFSLAAVDYPTRPIELVLAYPPGGGTDSGTIPFRERAGKILGQPIVSVYKPGAAGAVGTAFVANAKADGYTLIAAAQSSFILLPLTRDPGYTLDSFTPVCNFTESRLVYCVKEDSPYKTMRDFVEAAKTKKLIYASPGANTTGNILMELLARETGVQFIHVPYSGGATAFTAVLGGHADIGIAGGSLGMIGPGKLRAIAVNLEKRFSIMPDVPTLKEYGYPSRGLIYYGVWAPKGTPKEIINKLYQSFKKVGEENRDEIAKFLRGAEQAIHILSPEELGKEYEEEYAYFKKTLGEMGMLRKEK